MSDNYTPEELETIQTLLKNTIQNLETGLSDDQQIKYAPQLEKLRAKLQDVERKILWNSDPRYWHKTEQDSD